jgi:hypothetical protein
MTRKRKERRQKRIITCRRGCDRAERVLQVLKRAVDGGTAPSDPIVEQLKQCPEAFKVGEILGKAFDSLKYDRDGDVLGHRYLPPSGVIVPLFA